MEIRLDPRNRPRDVSRAAKQLYPLCRTYVSVFGWCLSSKSQALHHTPGSTFDPLNTLKPDGMSMAAFSYRNRYIHILS